MLTLGTGVGSGILCRGRPVAGTGYGGIAGHMIIRQGGRKCTCGKRGCLEAYASATALLKAYLLEQLKTVPGVSINSPADALPYVVNLSVAGIPSQVLINYLSERGIYVSAGSACKKGHRSEVLSVMGLPPARIDSAIRVSMSRYTTREELDVFVDELKNATKDIRTKL